MCAKIRREYDNYLEGEQREMIELLEKKGVSHEDAEQVRIGYCT